MDDRYISAYKGHLDCPVPVEAGEEENAKKTLRPVIKALEAMGLA